MKYILILILLMSNTAIAGSFIERVYGAGDVYIGDRVCDHALRGDWVLPIDGRPISCTIGDCGEFMCDTQNSNMLYDGRTFDGVVVEGAIANHWLFLVTDTPEDQYPEYIDTIYSAKCVDSLLYLDYLMGRTPRVVQTYMAPGK